MGYLKRFSQSLYTGNIDEYEPLNEFDKIKFSHGSSIESIINDRYSEINLLNQKKYNIEQIFNPLFDQKKYLESLIAL